MHIIQLGIAFLPKNNLDRLSCSYSVTLLIRGGASVVSNDEKV